MKKQELQSDKIQLFTKKIQSFSFKQTFDIIDFIIEHFNVDYDLLFSVSKKGNVATCRKWLYYFFYEGVKSNENRLLKFSSVDLAILFERDHGSILSGHKKIKNNISVYRDDLLLYHFLDTNIRVIINKKEEE